MDASSDNNRTVYQNEDGMWANKKNGAERASSLHETQKEAQDEARRQIKEDGGGELTTMAANENGSQIRAKDTVTPD